MWTSLGVRCGALLLLALCQVSVDSRDGPTVDVGCDMNIFSGCASATAAELESRFPHVRFPPGTKATCPLIRKMVKCARRASIGGCNEDTRRAIIDSFSIYEDVVSNCDAVLDPTTPSADTTTPNITSKSAPTPIHMATSAATPAATSTAAPTTITPMSTTTKSNIRQRNDVTCLDDRMLVSIPSDAIYYPNSRMLNNPTCLPTYNAVNNTIVLKFRLDECGTKVEIQADSVVYTNELREKYDRASPVLIKCVYKKASLASASFNTIDRKTALHETGQGQIDVQLVQYKFNRFNEPRGSSDISRDDRAYFRLDVTGAKYLKASAEKCIISPAGTLEGDDGITVIEKGCSAAPGVLAYVKFPSLAFSVPADLLTKSGLSYVHCTIVLCPSSGCYPSCSSGIVNRRRRAAGPVMAVRSVLVA